MSIYGDYAAQIIQGRRAAELRAEAQRDRTARRNAKTDTPGSGRGRNSRTAGARRARTA